MSEDINQNTSSQLYQMLPKSYLHTEAEAKRLLNRHGVEVDRIICFENVRWDFIENDDVYSHMPNDEYYHDITQEFLVKFSDYLERIIQRVLHNKEITALTDGYLSADGAIDPMRDAYNMEASAANGRLHLRLSDAIYIIEYAFDDLIEEEHLMVSYECAEHVCNYLTLFCIREKDRTDMYKSGALKANVKTKKHVRAVKPIFKTDPSTEVGKKVAERIARKAKKRAENPEDNVLSRDAFEERRKAFLAKKAAQKNAPQ